MSKLQEGESKNVFRCLIFLRQTCALSRTRSTLSFLLFFLLEDCFITSLLGVSSSELPLISPSITTLSAKPTSTPQLLLCPSKLVDSVSHQRQNISKTTHTNTHITYKRRKTFSIKEKVSVDVIVFYKKFRIQVLVLELTDEGL